METGIRCDRENLSKFIRIDYPATEVFLCFFVFTRNLTTLLNAFLWVSNRGKDNKMVLYLVHPRSLPGSEIQREPKGSLIQDYLTHKTLSIAKGESHGKTGEVSKVCGSNTREAHDSRCRIKG